MSSLRKPPRAPWLSGALVLVLLAALMAPFGFRLDPGDWAYYAGLAAVLLLAFGGIERMLKAMAAPRSPRTRGRLRVVRRGRGKHIDLAEDDTTDGQKWLM